MNYWDIVKPTYIENWDRPLHSLSIASISIPLLGDAPQRLGSNIIELGGAFCQTDAEREHNRLAIQWSEQACCAKMTGKPEPPNKIEYIKPTYVRGDISDIKTEVSEAVDKMPKGAFIRLGSRSPKDSYLLYKESGKISPGQDPLRFILDCSERIYEDLMLAIQQHYTPYIWVREWIDIPRWAEFRCFMKDRKLVGVSQYNYLDGEVFEEIDPGLCEWAIGVFFHRFLKATTLTSVVFDVFLDVKQRSPNSRDVEVKLLEINPFFELTDPCLFCWHTPFDGSFRYNKAKVNA
jgi:hypothetical protein